MWFKFGFYGGFSVVFMVVYVWFLWWFKCGFMVVKVWFCYHIFKFKEQDDS